MDMESELRGDLEKVALASVLGLLELENRTGVLLVQRGCPVPSEVVSRDQLVASRF